MTAPAGGDAGPQVQRRCCCPRARGRLNFTSGQLALAWSPDGKSLAFIQGDAQKRGASQIHVLRIATGEARALTTMPFTRLGLQFSNDGTRLFYSRISPPSELTAAIVNADEHVAGIYSVGIGGGAEVPVIQDNQYRIMGGGFLFALSTHLLQEFEEAKKKP